MAFTLIQNVDSDAGAKIKVIGVGGAGGNAINNMIDQQLKGVQFIAANTDQQALNTSQASLKIQIGRQLTEGLGAGANPERGREAALESFDEIKSTLEDSHMVFITAGFGGGTGTGAAPVVAEASRDLGALTVAVVSKPFSFEGTRRMKMAEKGIEELKQVCDTVITIPNDRLRGLAPKNARLIDMFKRADEILLNSVRGITDLIMMPGLVNLDFADIKTAMSKAGMAIMGIGVSSGENRAVEAASKAISHPLLEDCSISGATGVLLNIASNSDLTMDEAAEASDRIHDEVGDDAEIFWGTAIDDSLGEELRVTVIATGIGANCQEELNPLEQDIIPTMRKVRPLDSQGKLRDITDEDIRASRQPKGADLFQSDSKTERAEDGRIIRHKGLVIDQEDLEIPTFLRRGAD